MSSPLSGSREPSPWVRRLKSAPSERLAEAESARIDADTARRTAEQEAREALAAQKQAEAVRAAAESTAATLARERDEALARVAELERREPTTPAPEPEPEPEPAKAPLPELVEFAPVRRGAGLVVLLAVADLAAAATAVYLAYRDRLATPEGLTAMGTTVVLAALLRFGDRPASSVVIKQGTVVVTTGDGTERAELGHERTLVEVVGERGAARRKVVLLRKGKPTVTVDRGLVDVDAFVDAVRLWRPEAG